MAAKEWRVTIFSAPRRYPRTKAMNWPTASISYGPFPQAHTQTEEQRVVELCGMTRDIGLRGELANHAIPWQVYGCAAYLWSLEDGADIQKVRHALGALV